MAPCPCGHRSQVQPCGLSRAHARRCRPRQATPTSGLATAGRPGSTTEARSWSWRRCSKLAAECKRARKQSKLPKRQHTENVGGLLPTPVNPMDFAPKFVAYFRHRLAGVDWLAATVLAASLLTHRPRLPPHRCVAVRNQRPAQGSTLRAAMSVVKVCGGSLACRPPAFSKNAKCVRALCGLVPLLPIACAEPLPAVAQHPTHAHALGPTCSCAYLVPTLAPTVPCPNTAAMCLCHCPTHCAGTPSTRAALWCAWWRPRQASSCTSWWATLMM